MIRKLVERGIRYLKRDPEYRLTTPYATRDLVSILWYRGLQLLRGVLLWLRLGKAGWPVFRGRGVVIEQAYLVRVGSSVIFEDGVFVGALSERGVLLGSNVTIGRRAVIQCTGVVARRGVGLEVGSNSAIGAQSFLGAQGGIWIGSDVIMGPGVRIFSEDHLFASTELPIRKQGEKRLGVRIEDDCWIGAGATIVDGVTVGRGAVVAAGAVVTEAVPPFAIVGGVPARAIRQRSRT